MTFKNRTADQAFAEFGYSRGANEELNVQASVGRFVNDTVKVDRINDVIGELDIDKQVYAVSAGFQRELDYKIRNLLQVKLNNAETPPLVR